LSRFLGWNKRVLTAGQPISVEYAPFRNGDHGGALIAITFADGRVLIGRVVPGGPGASPVPATPARPAAPKEGQ
jgi:hypothetical protein